MMNVDHRLDAPTGYDAARLTALAAPLEPIVEAPALRRAVPRLQRCFDLDQAAAEALARRCVLFGRDRRLHETLTLLAAPASLRTIIDAIEIEGIERLGPSTRGRLFVAFHYGPYSSLLWLALACVAAAGRIQPLTFVLDRRLDPNLVMSRERWKLLVAHGVLRPQAFEPFDLAHRGIRAARDLTALMTTGGSVLIMPDAWFVPPNARHALECRIGQGTIWFPRGADWLSQQSGCEVVATRIEPTRTGHRIVLEPVRDVAAALKTLGAPVTADPAPWEGWTRDQPFF